MKSTTKANGKELFRQCFDTLKRLNAKNISVDEAKANAQLLKQANNFLKYELDRAKAIAKFENLEIREIEEL